MRFDGECLLNVGEIQEGSGRWNRHRGGFLQELVDRENESCKRLADCARGRNRFCDGLLTRSGIPFTFDE
jgi:hypothetical protein